MSNRVKAIPAARLGAVSPIPGADWLTTRVILVTLASMAVRLIKQVLDFPLWRALVRLDPVTRGWVTLVMGNAARLALGLGSSVLIARALAPSQYGVYLILGAFVYIVGAIADLGVSDAAVRDISSAWPQQPARAAQHAQAYLAIKIGAATLVVLVGVAFADPLARLLGVPDDTWLVLALLGIIATALSSSLGSILQAAGQFARLTLVTFSNTALTTLLAVALYATGQLTLVTALAVLGIATSLASFAIAQRLLPEAFGRLTLFALPKREVLRSDGGRLIRFGRWLWVSNILIMITGYFDVLLVGRWSAPAVVGFYGLGLNLVTKVDVVNTSLYTVLLPAAAALSDSHSLRLYVRRALVRSAVISLLLLPLVFLVPPFIVIFYGSAFEPAGMYFQAMFGLVIIDIFAWHLILLAFPFNQPKLLAAADALRAATMLSTAVWLVPIYGPLGAVAGKFAAKIAGAIFTLVALRRLQRTKTLGMGQE